MHKKNIVLLKKIAITGPESTGKSSLTKALAEYYHEPFVFEYARSYLNNKMLNYTIEDVIQIAKGQLQLEEKIAEKATKILFCDTDFLVTKVWCEVVFKTSPQWIEKQFNHHRYDLYLLCYPDMAWQPDPLRQNPNNRKELFILYENALKKNRLPYKIITGLGEKRIRNAIKFVNELLQ